VAFSKLMDLESTHGRGISGQLQVEITADRFPAITEACLADENFRTLIAENLERVVEEYLTAAEDQVAAAKAQPDNE